MSGYKSPALAQATSVRYAEPKPVRPTGILHFTLAVTDLERSRRFYEEVVGCTFWRQNDTTVFMRCGESFFVLSRSGYHAAPNRGRDTLIHHAFTIDAADPEDAARRYLMDGEETGSESAESEPEIVSVTQAGTPGGGR